MGEYVPGLEGVVAAETEISEVDGQGGRLIYRGGYLIQDVQELSYEEVAFLLLDGKLPGKGELETFKSKRAAP
jgi:citrate synthase